MTETLTLDRTWVVDVTVLPKSGVNDPQGEAIQGGLAALGYRAVRSVRSGRFFRLTVEATDADAAKRAVVAMCDQLLANPVIESYQVEVSEES
jgi:phosphoribosylformylglycinamidine synthase